MNIYHHQPKYTDERLLIGKSESKLSSAKVLFENGIYDDAISRGYYCMYYSAKAILLLKGKCPKTHRGRYFTVWFGICKKWRY